MLIQAPDFYSSDFGVAKVEWSLDRPAGVTMSEYNGQRTVVTNPWHGKWRASVTLESVVGDGPVRALRSFFARCQGSLGIFSLHAEPRPQNANAGVTLSALAAAGARSATIGGYATPLLDGHFLTIAGQMLLCTSDQAGGVLNFEPHLRLDAAAGTTVVTDRPYARVFLASQEVRWTLRGPGTVYDVAFEVEEAIEPGGVFPTFDEDDLTFDAITWDAA